jgi:hydrogenase maturation protease
MNKIKILGIGSPFGDDRVGWAVIEILQQNPDLMSYIPKLVHLEKLDRPSTGLLETMQDAKTVILIDAMKTGAHLGALYQFENPQFENPPKILSTHGMGVLETLQLGVALNELPKQITLYGIEIGEVTYENCISDLIRSAAITLTKTIASKFQKLLS